MTMAQVTEQDIFEIIQEALELNSGSISMESGMSNLDAWDSLGHLSILAHLDKVLEGKAAGIQLLAAADSAQLIVQILRDNDLVA
jgi:acyl carrier protein